MKIYVKQMLDYNHYAYCAENVDERHHKFFADELWWQLGDGFIKTFDNVQDFSYCAENFAKYGETAIRQQLKLIPSPWESALDLFVAKMQEIDVPWHIHGSCAIALWGLDVAPKDIDIIIPNRDDFDKVRNHLYKLAIKPIEPCENWIMTGLGSVFMESVIGLAFAYQNMEHKPFDMNKLGKVTHNGNEIFISSLEMLRDDNKFYDRPERVAMIQSALDN